MRLLMIVLAGILVSCDPQYHEAYLCNESNGGIEIKIKIDGEYVKKNWPDDQRIRFLKEFASDKNMLEVSLDTVSFQGTYRLENDKCVLLSEGLSNTPRFIFNYLEIDLKDRKLIFDTTEEIEKAFLHSGKNRYKLIVKE